MQVSAEDVARVAGVDPTRFRDYVNRNRRNEDLQGSYELGTTHHKMLARLLWMFILTEIRRGGEFGMDGGPAA